MYPLHEDYKTQVKDFLTVFLSNPEFNYKTNAMSTQATGEIESLMDWVQECIAETYEEGVKAAFIQKILPGELDLDYKFKDAD